MKLNKLFEQTNEEIKNLNNIGAVSFGPGQTDKNEDRTPTYLMNKGIEMYEINPIVQSGIDTIVEFIFPNKKIKVKSSDPESDAFVELWHEKRSHLHNDFKQSITVALCAGNTFFQNVFNDIEENNDYEYLLENATVKPLSNKNTLVKAREKTFKENFKDFEKQLKINNFFIFSDPSRIYVNPDSLTGVDAFVLELSQGTKAFMFNGKRRIASIHKVRYIKNNAFFYKSVWGIIISKWELQHIKIGYSRDNIYGRGIIASGIDAHNVMMEILSTWDTISKTRQKDQTIITPTDKFEGVLQQNVLDDLADKLESNNDKAYTILGIPLKLAAQDIQVSGKYDLMEGVFDILRRMLMVSLLPNFLTPWSDSATTQGAESSLPPFKQRIKSMQNTFINAFNETLLKELKRSYPDKVAQDMTYVFDTPQIMDDVYYIDTLTKLTDTGLITKEQMKEYLEKIGIIDEEKNASPPKKSIITQSSLSIAPSNALPQLESYEKPITEFDKFKDKIRSLDGKTTKDWEQINHREIEERIIQLIKTPNEYRLYDGLILKKTWIIQELKDIDGPKQIYLKYIEDLKKELEDFYDGETDEDKAVDEIEKFIKDEYDIRFKKLLKTIEDSGNKFENYDGVHKEKFLSLTIFQKFNDIFSDFNAKVKAKTNEIMKRLGLDVIKDKEVIGGNEDSPEKRDKKKLMQKRNILLDSMKAQITDTTDGILQDIKRDVSTGIVAGRSTSAIKAELEKKYNYKNGIGWKTQRTINNETRKATKILKLKKWYNMGFKEVQNITHIDDKTSAQCRPLNHKVFTIKYLLNHPEEIHRHINCRCSWNVYR